MESRVITPWRKQYWQKLHLASRSWSGNRRQRGRRAGLGGGMTELLQGHTMTFVLLIFSKSLEINATDPICVWSNQQTRETSSCSASTSADTSYVFPASRPRSLAQSTYTPISLSILSETHIQHAGTKTATHCRLPSSRPNASET